MRSSSLFLPKALAIGAALYFLGIALHEFGHLIVAWTSGTHIEAFRWYDPRFGGTSIQISGDTSRLVVRVGDFAGGLFAGAVMLGAGFLLRKRFRRSALWWLSGLVIAEVGFLELSSGFAEGLLQGVYGSTGAWAWGAADTVMVAGLAAGIIFYLAQAWRPGRPLYQDRP